MSLKNLTGLQGLLYSDARTHNDRAARDPHGSLKTVELLAPLEQGEQAL